MADAERKTASLTQRLGRFASISLLIIAVIALGFGASLLVNSQAIVGSVERRNARDLGVIAKLLESRQRQFARVASVKYHDGEKEALMRHPDLGDIRIRYYDCDSDLDQRSPETLRLFPRGFRPGDGPQYRISGEFRSSANSDGAEPAAADQPDGAAATETGKLVCFAMLLPLDRLIALDSTAPGLSNLLIVAPDGTTLEQIGGEELPLARLPTLKATDAFGKDLQKALTTGQSQTSEPGTVDLSASQGTAQLKVNDLDYRAYIRPFAMTVPPAACPAPAKPTAATTAGPTTAATAAPTTADARTTSVRPAECRLFLVGLMPQSAARSAWLAPARVVLVTFGLALLLVVVLLPLGRLLLINNTEAISGAEIAAMVFGLIAATAIATLAILFAIEFNGERRLADSEAQRMASSLAASVAREITKLDQASRICRGDPLRADGGALTAVIDGSFIDFEGRPKTEPLECAGVKLSTRARVGGRPYFRALKNLPEGTDGFVVDQIVSQTDGIAKTVLARRGRCPECRKIPPDKDPRFAVRVSTVLRTLTSPTLPPPERFMVVDTSGEGLPVLFHSNPSRAGIEDFADQTRASEPIARALRQLAPGSGTVRFTRRYDGIVSRFAAARVPGTGWAVLVFYRTDDVDEIAGRTAARALVGWTSISIIALFAAALLLMIRGVRWHYLWPLEDGGPVYRSCTRWAAAIAAVVMLASLLLHPMPLVAVLVSSGFAVWTHHCLTRRRPSAAPTTPAVEQDYLRFVLAMLACVAAAPMVAFWSDARSLSRAEVDVQRADAARHALDEESERLGALRPVVQDVRPGIALPERAVAKGTVETQHAGGFTADMMTWQNSLAAPTIARCRLAEKEEPGADPDRAWFCRADDRLGVFERGLAVPGLSPWVLITLLAAALAVLLYAMVRAGLKALTGFGIPLGAVSWPRLVVDAKARSEENEQELAAKSLLVAPQQAVRDKLAGRPNALVVNLADELLPVADEAFKDIRFRPWRPVAAPQVPPHLIVSGLELVLRDAPRRRAALAYLERAVSVLGRKGQRELAGVVVIAEMAPLERILDAFESFSEADDKRLSTREELRWARLFQDFSTFYFAPIDKVDDAKVPPDLGEAARTMVEELRWLPGAVIDGVIANHESRTLLTEGTTLFPLPEEDYREHYTPLIVGWAVHARALDREAAVDYLRANLIEHYEQCWAASSFAERVILDAIARGSFINMRRGVALQSLVRRGLVILDPAPRLMNRSFALYVRQSERPDTLARWKAAQPRSAWAAARLPLAFVLPALVVLLAVAAGESGQPLNALLPLLAAGAPALIGSLVRMAKTAQ